MPILSVIIPAYNIENYIKKSLCVIIINKIKFRFSMCAECIRYRDYCN